MGRRMGVETLRDVMRRWRVRWHGHVERKDDVDCVKARTRFVVDVKAPVGRPWKTWVERSVSRHASPGSLPPGRPQPNEMEGYRKA